MGEAFIRDPLRILGLIPKEFIVNTETKRWILLLVPPLVVVSITLYFFGIPGVLALVLLVVCVWGWSHVVPDLEELLKELRAKVKGASMKKKPKADWATKEELEKAIQLVSLQIQEIKPHSFVTREEFRDASRQVLRQIESLREELKPEPEEKASEE